MSQTFQPNTPPTNGSAVSQEIRDSLAALLSNHQGATPPAYLVEGATYFGQPDAVHEWSGGGHLHAVKEYGSIPFGSWPMTSTVTLIGSPWLPGVDGAMVEPTIRVANENILGPGVVGDVDLYYGGTEMRIWFSSSIAPSRHAAFQWPTNAIQQPVIISADGRLLGKLWETIPPGNDYIEYAVGSPSVLLNGPDYADGIRVVDIEKKINRYDFYPFITQDHITIPAADNNNTLYWWEVQQYLLSYSLLENGVAKRPDAFKVVPFTFDGLSVYFVVYNISNGDLTPFVNNGWYQLSVTKGT